MLQFWKKTGQDKSSPRNVTNFCTKDNALSSKLQNSSQKISEKQPCHFVLGNLNDEGLSDIGDFESTKERSRLSKTLKDIIADKNALDYFIQYMETRNASQYILCWVDIETFKSELTSVQFSKISKSPNSLVNSTIDHDSLSVSTDCDSFTADSNSLCDFSSNITSEVKPQNCDQETSESRLTTVNEDSVSSEKHVIQQIVDNSLMLFKKYIALEANNNIQCSEEIRKEVMESICETDKISCSFDKVQNFVFNIMENEYLPAFLGSDYFCKYQVDVLTSGNVILDDILYNETALFYFMEFLEQENQRPLLDFWIAATNFHQQLQDQKDFFDATEAQSDAVVLYDKYFSLQAFCPLGFTDKVRLAVEQNICGENGLMLDCFHLPLKIVEKVLEKHYLKPFLSSQLFYKYLSDLISTIQVHGYSSNNDENKICASDCSSEKSYSQITFLALEVPRGDDKNKISRTEKCSDMTIDTRQLYDPDSLWKRKKIHRLSLGHVNNLGKYIAEFEPEPDRREFGLKNMLKKVVSKDEDTKKKEEMAWQVAEMIVRDITNITLSDQKL